MGSDLYMLGQQIALETQPRLREMLVAVERMIRYEGWMALQAYLPEIQKALAESVIR